jgi:hypothetical protein
MISLENATLLLSDINDILNSNPKTMWDIADPRLNPKKSWKSSLASLKGIHSEGFTHLFVITHDSKPIKAHFNVLGQDGYVFQNGTVYMTCDGMNIHENGFITAEVGEWVIAEYQCGFTDSEVLSKYREVEYNSMMWRLCVQEE